MTPQEARNLELVRTAVAHLEKRYQEVQEDGRERYTPFNYRPFLDLLSDDAVFAAPAPPGTPVYGSEFRGKEAIKKLFLEDDADLVDSDALRVERAPEYFVNGNRAIVLTSYTYTIRKTGVVARNKDIALVLDFKDGQITRAVEIQDLSEWTASYTQA